MTEHKKVRILLNGEPVTPESIMKDFRDRGLSVVEELTTGRWQEEEHYAILHIEYESWTYDVDVYDLSEYEVDWRMVFKDDVHIKWSWCDINYCVQGTDHNYDYDLPSFDPPEGLDYKRPNKWSIEHSTYVTELELNDLMCDCPQWGDIDDLIEFHSDSEYDEVETLDD